jgi:hypothetical protein
MTQSKQAAAVPPQAQILNMLMGPWIAQSLYAAAKLGLADLVKDGPKSSDDLARATGMHPRSLYRLLRALASRGVFTEEPGRRFALTPLAECLRSDVPGSQRPAVLMMGEEHYLSWADVLYSLQTGRPAFDRRFGQPIFQYLAANPAQAKVFDAAMTAIHGGETRPMLDAYDFSGIGTLVDIGGGNGTLLCEALKQYPGLRGILFDRPDVIERAQANLRAAGLEQRCRAVGGDFFKAVPQGGDAYLLRHIIHDWDDEQSRTILASCRQAMGKGARLLLVESVIPPGNEPFFGKWLDLNMLVIPGGLERTEAEYRDLFGAAGFRLTRVVPTRLEVSVIEGEPV